MNEYEVFYKNGDFKKFKGRYIDIDKDYILIDNIRKAETNEIAEIRFIAKKYYQIIHL